MQRQEPRPRTVPVNRFMALHARLSEGSQQSFVISEWGYGASLMVLS